MAHVTEDWENLEFRVHRSAYRASNVYDAEIKRIWAHNWLYLGHETEIPEPGQFKVRVLGGRSLIFCRDAGGQVHAFLNSCPHRGTILCRDTEGQTRHFQCFYHAWTFNTDGSAASIPDAEAYPDSDRFRSWATLREVARLDTHEGFVFVSFDKDVPELLEHLGEAADYLTMAVQPSAAGMTVVPGAHLYTVRGNWKLNVENAMDGYHFAPTHNTFLGYLRETGYQMTDEGHRFAKNLGNGHSALVLKSRRGRVGMLWEPRFGEAEKARIEQNRAEMDARLGPDRADAIAGSNRILFIFPNLLFFDLESYSIRQLEPTAAGTTDVRAWNFVPEGEPDEVRELRLRILTSFVGPGGLASPDDIEAYEAVQRGISATTDDQAPDTDWSDMSRGMADELAGKPGRSVDEGAMRSFWRHWAHSVGEVPING
ncbi:aromatic ring-hydroxylating oxygenase subunit alpha [Cryptosporangium phraense]|uniref:Rieske 2Fe-2S domain-containing protein n=1 Tax=Cryptosporangium phraense TaxID=2593070 RepID=A0A545AQ18_9ACTN|nr:aromatic ring-hydroxylating dioxygenase subunit alpha [Cryptosporangium phraense]TQS43422.1 Rieske 2Fe-2S domain-containing protein [Cryptosporangium phraense]